MNLSLQVLDGILCHDGEIHQERLSPDREKSFADFYREIDRKQDDPQAPLKPMTLEGCVVRLADTISYIGRDLEDAILLGMVRRQDLPEVVKERITHLGHEFMLAIASVVLVTVVLLPIREAFGGAGVALGVGEPVAGLPVQLVGVEAAQAAAQQDLGKAGGVDRKSVV